MANLDIKVYQENLQLLKFSLNNIINTAMKMQTDYFIIKSRDQVKYYTLISSCHKLN